MKTTTVHKYCWVYCYELKKFFKMEFFLLLTSAFGGQVLLLYIYAVQRLRGFNPFKIFRQSPNQKRRQLPVTRSPTSLRQGLRSKTSKMLELKFLTINYVNKNYRRELK